MEPKSVQEILQECVDKTGKQPKKNDLWVSPSFEASQLFGAAGLGTKSPAATNGFSPSEMLGESTGLTATDLLSSKLRDSVSAMKLRARETAAITGASVFVTAAGVAVGYLVYRKRKKDLNGDGGAQLVFTHRRMNNNNHIAGHLVFASQKSSMLRCVKNCSF
jgi:hypothetical protein